MFIFPGAYFCFKSPVLTLQSTEESPSCLAPAGMARRTVGLKWVGLLLALCAVSWAGTLWALWAALDAGHTHSPVGHGSAHAPGPPHSDLLGTARRLFDQANPVRGADTDDEGDQEDDGDDGDDGEEHEDGGEHGIVRRVSDLTMNEMYQAVMESTPTVITNGGACTKHAWTVEWLREVAGEDTVAVERSKNNRFYDGGGPEKRRMRLSRFLDVFMSQPRQWEYYLAEQGMEQTPALLTDVMVPEFAAFMNVDRTQLWIGAGGQVSPLHHDHWDNILCQLEGTRTFTIFDPFQVEYLYPRRGEEDMYFSQVDPANPDLKRFPKFAHAEPTTVVLNAGEMLFLPAYWWHQVQHAPRRNMAVNFWFFPNEVASAFLKGVLVAGQGEGKGGPESEVP